MEEQENKNNYTTTEISGFSKFLWWCSGANQEIVLQCPQSEHYKYQGIGATVFFTGILAALSGAYALYTVFNNEYAAVAFGCLWGLVIFNLDRFIVATIRKENNFWNEFKIALPRIILAIILAIVIAKPLELKIFEKEIAQKIQEQQQDFAITAQQKTAQQFNPLADSLRKEIDYYKSELQKIATQRDTLYQAFIGEAEGTSGTYKLGKGPVYKEKKQQFDKIEQALKDAQDKYEPLIQEREQQILNYKAKRDTAFANSMPTITNYDGLMARLDAQSKLPQLPIFFITLLFICIETAPVLAKLLAKKGPYDDFLKNIEHEIELNTIANINQRNHDLNKKMTLYTNIDKAKIEQDISTNEEQIRIMAEANLQITKDYVDNWLQNEREKLKQQKD